MAETGFKPIELKNLPGENLLAAAEKSATSMIAGEIPKDVLEQIDIRTSERGIAGGIGMGQAQRNLTARDIGQTSFDIASRGISFASELSDAMLRQEALKEQRFEFNKKFEIMLRETQVKEDALSLSAHEMISENQQFAMSLANSLILQNSVSEIAGVQENIDAILGSDTGEGFFQPTNAAILDLVAKYTGG